MAEKLVKYYKYIGDSMGIDGRMKLAFETKIPSLSAANFPDSPENIQKFKDAIQKITGNPAPNL
ncbi:MAG TPA: hypothetical protein DIW31_08000 [Bacteroidales bacterium]|nr:hypothetical protein [Bacteroidales bacterium]